MKTTIRIVVSLASILSLTSAHCSEQNSDKKRSESDREICEKVVRAVIERSPVAKEIERDIRARVGVKEKADTIIEKQLIRSVVFRPEMDLRFLAPHLERIDLYTRRAQQVLRARRCQVILLHPLIAVAR